MRFEIASDMFTELPQNLNTFSMMMMMIILLYIYNQKHGSCFGAVAATYLKSENYCGYCSGPCHDLRQTMSNFQIILIDAMNLAQLSPDGTRGLS